MVFRKMFLDILLQRRTGNLLAISVIAIFLILGLMQLYPFVNHFDNILNGSGDDWKAYAWYGRNIVHNGVLLPVKDLYRAPAGFLYNYFIALCLFIFGETDVPIYIIQVLMLGLSVALTYWTFRDKMTNLTSVMFLAALSLFALLDVFRYYAFLLLSENLGLFLVSLFFFCFIRGFEKNKLILQLLSAFFMGLLILTRPQFVLFGFISIFIITPLYLSKGKIGRIQLLLFIATLILSTSFLGIRNYLVTGQLRFLPVQKVGLETLQSTFPIPSSVNLSKNVAFYAKLHINSQISAFMEYIVQQPLLFIIQFFKRVLFCLGFNSIMNPAYHVRPHWILMWIGYFVYLFLHFKRHDKIKLWEVTVQLYLLCYYVPLVMFILIECYGFRYLLLATNFVLVFSFLALDRLREKWNNSHLPSSF